MEKIGFIGGYDKTDLIIYTAKVLTELGNKVLILDTTITQKTRYIVPAINPTISYITDFQNIDIAVGFNSFEEIQEYFGVGDGELQYDYALIDMDRLTEAEKIGISIINKVYFVTAFDLYSLKKGVEILGNLKNPLRLTKVYFSRGMFNEDDEYLEFLALGKKVIWDDTIMYFPLESGDQSSIAENQRLGKIKFKNLTFDYKEGISAIVCNITGERIKDIKMLIKNLE